MNENRRGTAPATPSALEADAAPDGAVEICHNCEEPLTGEPVYFDGEAYCCTGCVNGGPCRCTYISRRPVSAAAPVAWAAPAEQQQRETAPAHRAPADAASVLDDAASAAGYLSDAASAAGYLSDAASAVDTHEHAVPAPGAPAEATSGTALRTLVLRVGTFENQLQLLRFASDLESDARITEVSLIRAGDLTDAWLSVRTTSADTLASALHHLDGFEVSSASVLPGGMEARIRPLAVAEEPPTVLPPRQRPRIAWSESLATLRRTATPPAPAPAPAASIAPAPIAPAPAAPRPAPPMTRTTGAEERPAASRATEPMLPPTPPAPRPAPPAAPSASPVAQPVPSPAPAAPAAPSTPAPEPPYAAPSYAPAPSATWPEQQQVPIEPPAAAAPAAPAPTPAPASAPAAAQPTDDGVESRMVGVDERPGGAVALTEHVTLVVYPFRSFGALNDFQAAVHALRGVKSVRVRRFYKGTLHLAVEYEDVIPLIQRLRDLTSFPWDLVSESRTELEIRLDAGHAFAAGEGDR